MGQLSSFWALRKATRVSKSAKQKGAQKNFSNTTAVRDLRKGL